MREEKEGRSVDKLKKKFNFSVQIDYDFGLIWWFENSVIDWFDNRFKTLEHDQPNTVPSET